MSSLTTCFVCGDPACEDRGIPVYEDYVVPNSWQGEWHPAPTCVPCFNLQSQLIGATPVQDLRSLKTTQVERFLDLLQLQALQSRGWFWSVGFHPEFRFECRAWKYPINRIEDINKKRTVKIHIAYGGSFEEAITNLLFKITNLPRHLK